MNKIKVIVADDVEPILLYIENIFSKKSEFDVVAKAKDGKELVEYIRENNPDIVITDIGMPIYSGFEVIEKMNKEIDKNIKYILMTGNEDFETVQRANNLGVLKIIKKPIMDEAKFIEEVNEAINKSQNEENRLEKNIFETEKNINKNKFSIIKKFFKQ